MISYELAQELKNKGFIQRVGVDTWCWTEDGWRLAMSIGSIDLPSVLISPNLSQLIEACGDKFKYIAKERQTNGLGEWYASAGEIWKNDCSWGKTPEEAVADLWLKLHE